MKLNRDKAANEIEKLFNWFPRYGMTEAKEEALTIDLLEMAENWEEAAFLEACKRIRRAEKRFPLLVDFESVYNQVLAENRANRSDQDDLEKDHRRRMREHNELWSQVSTSSDLPWIMEQATDEIDAALEKMGTPQKGSAMTEQGIAWIIDKIRKNRETAIRGRACEIWKESRE